jgi:hypothetical protein
MIPVPWIIAGVTAALGVAGAGVAVYTVTAAPDSQEDPTGSEIAGLPVQDAQSLALATVAAIARTASACGPLASTWLQLLREHEDKEAQGKTGFMGASRAARTARLARLAREIATCAGPVDMRRFGWERVGAFVTATGAVVADVIEAKKIAGDKRDKEAKT